jgi:integrase/recombinase XerD
MAIDPKKDPSRRCRPVAEWPDLDRLAWQAAISLGDVLEPGGGASELAAQSRKKISKGYGRWLTWLGTRGLLDPKTEPAGRVTPEAVRDYVADLRTAKNAPYTVLARVQELYQAIRVMAPERDWAWLRDIENRVGYGAASIRNKRMRVVSAEDLLGLGIELMIKAENTEDSSALKRALRYRDGLLIAILAARPLRRRNLAAIEIGRHLVREGDAYWLRFKADETKTGEPIEALLPIALSPYVERYISAYRPLLLARSRGSKRQGSDLVVAANALWIASRGFPMTEMGIYLRICEQTQKRFGHAINPHLFRDSAATSIAIEDPKHVHVIRSVLGHSTIKTGERYYVHAQSLEASRRYQRRILQLRRGAQRRRQ